MGVADLKTYKALGWISGMKVPVGLAVSPKTPWLYVTNRDLNTVSVIDPTTGQLVGSIPLASTPGGKWPGKSPTDGR
ncbi:MAG: hypothetical protein COZ06_32885 [Armatimonadetes bacterium CG_4_10_14_3_um_filter_66_18]|nr:hypothetical protein [Armatimonadota bacterium]OIO95610.1 MAG: hypothetical protein AUJ96_26455 [Armatimonadetes bacterium CG2_30_66_41]PIU94997.1 MAG: hypothetical protein COS65_04800 [Armatimonadetes bacterium CG06_land_8_20_14_3_00_66_21]PIW16383.1 MAG: hypothetical protein COW34_05955 [Armatimonadetes bacterium CG17_big_fil_post_rev_8_21_14_2_50_66_6]PIX49752.1 MAG: hypothetical protein COZ57_02355 [Armatimonadetes bacterium CG_4_8_14_3_um_filter_66_20]PIY37490.1 MAG: hypothetical prote